MLDWIFDWIIAIIFLFVIAAIILAVSNLEAIISWCIASIKYIVWRFSGKADKDLDEYENYLRSTVDPERGDGIEKFMKPLRKKDSLSRDIVTSLNERHRKEKEQDSSESYSPDQIANETENLINSYLRSSGSYNLNIFTFTEIFAFLFFQIDSVLFKKGISKRDEISQALYRKYQTIIANRKFPLEQTEIYYTDTLDFRISEYGEMLRKRKEMADIVERLTFYLDQCDAGKFHTNNSPLVLKDFFKMTEGRTDIVAFYTETAANFVMKIVKLLD
ncbi:hypothetical protein ACFL6U_06995 [Planctomycetota bacterium]